jgi:hypothetical protein
MLVIIDSDLFAAIDEASVIVVIVVIIVFVLIDCGLVGSGTGLALPLNKSIIDKVLVTSVAKNYMITCKYQLNDNIKRTTEHCFGVYIPNLQC